MNTHLERAIQIGLSVAKLEHDQSEHIGRECRQLVSSFAATREAVWAQCRSARTPLACPLTIKHRQSRIGGHHLEWLRIFKDPNGEIFTDPILLRRNSTEYSPGGLERGLPRPFREFVIATEISAKALRIENAWLMNLRTANRALSRSVAESQLTAVAPRQRQRISTQTVLQGIQEGMDNFSSAKSQHMTQDSNEA